VAKFEKMDYLSLIKQPIAQEFNEFTELFSQSLTYGDGLVSDVLSHIRQRGGKRMRPILMLLIAKNFGNVTKVTQHSAIGLELLHTASLVHDDVVDESEERRGQASVNASYNNKVAVLTGDFILSTALLHVSYTNNQRIIENLAQLGRTLASGELLQLQNISNQEISEEIYYDVIKQKTAVLFESCASIGAMSAGASDEEVAQAAEFGRNLGIMFQIRDDIFDYYDSKEIGKPTGNDMAEGKLTLPIIYALNKNPQYESMMTLARKVKAGTVNADEIAVLVEFTKECGGIEYAEKRMNDYYLKAKSFIDKAVNDEALRTSLTAYIDYVIKRNL
jgi:octaprenyl-diphosphate synthase